MIQAAIISDRVVTSAGTKKAAVIINDGKIHDILTVEAPGGDFPIIDVGNNILMAGIVDPHVHINEPGSTDWEGFDTATRSAISRTPLIASGATSTAITTGGRAAIRFAPWLMSKVPL